MDGELTERDYQEANMECATTAHVPSINFHAGDCPDSYRVDIKDMLF